MNGKLIVKLRNEMGISQEELAFKVGVSQRAISRWESGIEPRNKAQKVRLCEVLNISEADLYEIHFKQIQHAQIPIIKWDDLSRVAMNHSIIHTIYIDMFPVPVSIYADSVFCTYITDDSMSPQFNMGDMIIANSDLIPEKNDFGLFWNPENSNILLRKLTFFEVKHSLKKKILHPNNPNYDDVEINHYKPYKSIAKITGHIQNFR